jgi:hypothetical protein
MQKIKSNRNNEEELVEHMADLLDLVQEAPGAQNQDDVSAGLKTDLIHFNQYVSPLILSNPSLYALLEGI